MRKYTVLYDSDMGYCAMVEYEWGRGQVSFWYTTLARLNRYWGVKSGIRFKSVKDVVYK